MGARSNIAFDGSSSWSASNAQIGLWDWDVPNNLVFGNETASTMFGLRALDAARGLPLRVWIDRIHPDDFNRVNAEIARTVRDAATFSAPYRVRRADDQYYWLHAIGQCIADEHGRPLRYPGFMIDVSSPRNNQFSGPQQPLTLEIMQELLGSIRLAAADLNDDVLAHLIDVAIYHVNHKVRAEREPRHRLN